MFSKLTIDDLDRLDDILDFVCEFAEDRLIEISNKDMFRNLHNWLRYTYDTNRIIERAKYTFKILITLYLDDLSNFAKLQSKVKGKLNDAVNKNNEFLEQVSEVIDEIENMHLKTTSIY